jgi:hypothetical protein
VLLIKGGLSLASSGAKAGVVWVFVEETHAVVGIVGLAILLDQRSIDSSGEAAGCIEVVNNRGRLACGCIGLRVS